jgi:phospholipid/cholesterol/gamma-HCH transport system substrate-binding protein
MAVGFVLWYTDANDKQDYDLYEIYFTGSVSGLDRGSPVRYLGVDVGRVRRLSIDKRRLPAASSQSPKSIARRRSARRRAPASVCKGVTGLLFINLKEVPNIDKSVPLAPGRALSGDSVDRVGLRRVPVRPCRS